MDPDRLLLTVGLILATFFLTALACHGELAKIVSLTKHLTEFYLWMSVGGMLGGMFNALVAPIVFKYVIEFNIALVVAGLVLPRTKLGGWTDDYLTDRTARQPQNAPRRAAWQHPQDRRYRSGQSDAPRPRRRTTHRAFCPGSSS